MQTGGDREENPCQFIHNMRSGSIAGFRYFECDCKEISLKIKGDGGKIDVMFDMHGKAVASIEFDASSECIECSAPLEFDGKRAIYLKYSGKGSIDLLTLELK